MLLKAISLIDLEIFHTFAFCWTGYSSCGRIIWNHINFSADQITYSTSFCVLYLPSKPKTAIGRTTNLLAIHWTPWYQTTKKANICSSDVDIDLKAIYNEIEFLISANIFLIIHYSHQHLNHFLSTCFLTVQPTQSTQSQPRNATGAEITKPTNTPDLLHKYLE